MPVVIVVVGAGVSGLTTALLLARSHGHAVTVVAKHMPGDYDAEYASPWAGANVLPMASAANSRWERRTWPELKRLAEHVPEAGIHFQKSHVYRRNRDLQKPAVLLDALFDREPWYRALLPDFRELAAHEMIPGYDSGCEFTSVCINTATYLQWLLGQCLRYGVVVRRAELEDITEAKALSHTESPASIVVNATGLGARKLGGVRDATMFPVRGQTVLVRNECEPMVTTSDTDDGDDEVLYVMQRAGGGGTILGGTIEHNNWDTRPNLDVANRIMARAVLACPGLTCGRGVAGLSVVRHNVGLRPFRRDGVRIEAEAAAGGSWIVHNYGHSGWGYQGSYGCAERVVELVSQIRRETGQKL